MNQSYIRILFQRFFAKPLEIQLVEACEAIPGLQKLGSNEELGFDYLRIVDLANALREELLPRGIVMIPNDIECIEHEVDTSEGLMIEARVKTEFLVTNGWKTIKFCSYGAARDPNGFAIPIAQTMGLKAVLKRISLTYGEADDHEVRRDAASPKETVRIASYQKRAWDAGVRDSGVPLEKISAELSALMGFPIDAAEIPGLPQKDFDVCMKWLLSHQDLSGQWEKALENVQAGKPQPVVAVLDQEREIAGD